MKDNLDLDGRRCLICQHTRSKRDVRQQVASTIERDFRLYETFKKVEVKVQVRLPEFIMLAIISWQCLPSV